MDKKTTDILNDLYTIDPNLKAQKKELRKIVSELLVSKPDTHFNENFAANLRSELLKTEIRPLSSPYMSIFVSRVFYGVLGSALTLLIAVPLTYVATQKATQPDKPISFNPFSNQVKNIISGLTPKQQISNKGINAFGKLAFVPTPDAPAGSATPNMSASPARPEGVASVPPKPEASSTDASAGYTYTYKGDPITLKESDGTVFKRTKGIDSGKQLSDIIKNSKFNLTDLSTFGNVNLKDITLTEDKPFGYVISVHFDEGTIAISPQAGYWSEQGTATSTPTALDNPTLLSIADAFTKAHAMDMNIYGKPVVTSSSTVTYPLLIDKKEVYESNGAPFGLVMKIDAGQKKVSEVGNLTSQVYDSSQYKLETNPDAVVGAATSTLTGNAKLSGNSSTTREASLGTPRQVLMRYWFYDEKAQTNEELYVPALLFPVTYSDSDAQALPKTVIIPLVKDFQSKQTPSSPNQ